MDYTTFRKAWDASGLPEYYERMDDLQRLGFTFDAHGDMDHYETLALHEWLTDERGIIAVTLVEVEAAKPGILAAAAILRENETNPATGSTRNDHE